MWQFTIIDYTQNATNPQSTIIQEPIGWDAVNLHLKRDETGHGFFGFEDDTFSSLQYDGNGAAILRAAYYTYGIQAKVQLAVTYNCDGTDPDNNLYLGTFDFTTFKDYVADRCYVECATLVSQAYYLFKNRKDQQVDLDSLASFDQLPVTQTVTCNAAFESGTNQIRVTQLLNGLMPGSKITIAGTANNNRPFFTVASAKPDYTNVNPDLTSFNSGGTLIASATFDAANKQIDINRLVNIEPNTPITIGTASWPSGNNTYPIYDNSGVYNVTAVQQFFNYTRLTISTVSISNTNALNGAVAPGYMVTTSQDTVSIQGAIAYTAQPTATIITVAEQLNAEQAGAVILGGITGNILSVVNVISGQVHVGQAITGGKGVNLGVTITVRINANTFLLSASQGSPSGVATITTGVTFTGQWLQNNLQPYSALSKIITMPAKEIFATSLWLNPQQKFYPLTSKGVGMPQTPFLMILTPDWPNVQSDIDETDVADGVPIYKPDASNPPDTLLYYRQQALACQGTGKLTINLSGSFVDTPGDTIAWQITSNDLTMGTPAFTPNSVHIVAIKDTTWQGISGYNKNSAQVVVDDTINFIPGTTTLTPYTNTINNITMQPGEYLWVFFHFVVAYTPDPFNPVLPGPQLALDAQSYFEFTLGSTCEDTPCSVYLVNEALSRCTESYTNGQIQVYSDYFGRTNAQPVASAADGCGALACITNGLRIRGCLMPDGSAIPKFFTSLNDMFTALDAIHNIGMGMEPDPNRPGMLRLRIEPFEWFFPDTQIFNPPVVLSGVMNYTRQVQTQLMCSTFKCGYQQFETWNNNGLYDIFGDRKYRTPLNHLENEIDKTCKWMASDYAIEFTRRQFGITSSDGRYDDATFILCLENNIQGPVEFVSNCLYIYDPLNKLLGSGFGSCVGHLIEISGASNAGNIYNGVVTQVLISAASPLFKFVFVTAPAFVNEQCALVGVNVPSLSIQISHPGYFVSATGLIILLENELFGANNADIISIGNAGTVDGNYTISEIYAQYPVDTINTADYPMVIFPTVLPTGLVAYLYATLAIIRDVSTPVYIVEQGMQNGTNVLSPDTVMNYRISPAQAAMRHYRNIITDRQYANEHLIFTGGTGNFYALGQLADSCSPENGNISEGGDLSLSNFTVPDDGKPLFYPEIIKFEYPLTWAQFLQIQANPYGLIHFEHANDGVQQGWLTDLQYHPYTGLAEFTLYPKI